jgi:endonuclease/exonuclease/phosphatase family metal-dependent hydrolase
MKFKPKIDLIIISIYLPHDPKERKIASLSLIKFLREHSNKCHILCGDFNTYPTYAPAINAPTTKQRRNIYNFLQTWIDVAKATD